MPPDRNPKRFARFLFIAGITLLFLGSVLLILDFEKVSRLSMFLAFLFMGAGIGCAVRAIRFHKRSLYLFVAAFSLQASFFLLLSAIKVLPITFSQYWPLISIFSGIALFPAGWHRYGVFKVRYIVPSLAFIFLGSVLLVFSFDLVPFSFRQFILNWWVLLVVLAGLVLVLVALSTKNASTKDLR
ncbi:hypothetical protein FACS1894172_10250 [Spirochaetia bacterium]|nr:hypothetical protein FACS1894164_13030 [Spirochaetia bacterium]GHU32856.1 hypothetical protein FACS1894172_10250 [Spirochaetia bacterium]